MDQREQARRKAFEQAKRKAFDELGITDALREERKEARERAGAALTKKVLARIADGKTKIPSMKSLTMRPKVLTDPAKKRALSRMLAKQNDEITDIKEVLFGADERGAVVAVVRKSGEIVELRPHVKVAGLSI
jgi:hypothetical protein